MAQLKKEDGRVALAANTIIESGQGTIIVYVSDTDEVGQKISLNENTLPVNIPGDSGLDEGAIEALGSSIAFYETAVTSLTLGDSAVSSSDITVAASAELVISGGRGTAVIDGVKIRLNNINYPFTFTNPSSTDAATVELLGNSVLFHEA